MKVSSFVLQIYKKNIMKKKRNGIKEVSIYNMDEETLNEFMVDNPKAFTFYMYLVNEKRKCEYEGDEYVEACKCDISITNKMQYRLCGNKKLNFYDVVRYLVEKEYILKYKKGIYFFNPKYLNVFTVEHKNAMNYDESVDYANNLEKVFKKADTMRLNQRAKKSKK